MNPLTSPNHTTYATGPASPAVVRRDASHAVGPLTHQDHINGVLPREAPKTVAPRRTHSSSSHESIKPSLYSFQPAESIDHPFLFSNCGLCSQKAPNKDIRTNHCQEAHSCYTQTLCPHCCHWHNKECCQAQIENQFCRSLKAPVLV